MRHYEGKCTYYERFEAIMKNNEIVPEDYKIEFYNVTPSAFCAEVVEYGLVAKGFRKPFAIYNVYYDSTRNAIHMDTCKLEYWDEEVYKRMEERQRREMYKMAN